MILFIFFPKIFRPGYNHIDQYVRRIDKAFVNTSINFFHPYNPDLIELEFQGPGFLTYQIRYMVAALVDLCLDKISIEDIEKALKLEQHNYKKYRAPAKGLFLKDVEFVNQNK
jgi:tRNA pseudouridine(38-40) synthase